MSQQAISTPAEHDHKQFHHAGRDGAGCSCPIHRNRERDPFTAPLGLSFADHVAVDTISQQQAADVYASHHGYMDDVPSVNLTHHGLAYQGALVGAITYRYPLLSRKRLHFDADGELLPHPHTDADYDRLPDALAATARRIIPDVDEEDVASTEIVPGDAFVEAARICLGVRMPNLASASLARSQELFVESAACADDVRYLLTFVRADYDGAMIRALRDKGWLCTGWTTPSQAGNREDRSIRERHKWRFLCPVDRVRDQATLGRWV